ncbi:MAG TPA: UbiD family decarboxylase [Acidimicrobiales bacterium]|nr:UbiD family decarboxylase [Acidimicrobiales bacterium]
MPRTYRDLRGHIEALRDQGLLITVDRAIDKDTELHPLVRWQYRGGVPEADRRAFLFTNVVDARGRSYQNPVLVGALAATPAVYAVGLDTPLDDVGARWARALAAPVDPVVVDGGPVQEVVHEGGEGGGFDTMPIPISTPGFDNAPYLTGAHAVTRSPVDGVGNVGHYRGQVKSPTTCGVFFTAAAKHGYRHWAEARDLGRPLELAFVVGAPPAVSYAAVSQVPYGTDEYAVAGGLAGEPIELVAARTVDLQVPADAEIVIEGVVHTDRVEPEGPFGESHGYVHPRSLSPVFEITCVTHRREYRWTSFISQVTPSESSVIKKVSLEPMLLSFLADTLGIEGVSRVVAHEPLTNLRKVLFVVFDQPRRTEVWRALKAVAAYRGEIGKIVVAVDGDVDPHNPDAVWWAMAYRARPHRDVQILEGQARGHAPPFGSDEEDANLLVDATLKDRVPPISLPTRPYMEAARAIWEELGLAPLRPEEPWHGYVLSPEEWPAELAEEAALAIAGRHYETGTKLGERWQPS